MIHFLGWTHTPQLQFIVRCGISVSTAYASGDRLKSRWKDVTCPDCLMRRSKS